jgi:hypothetical protein
VEQDEAVSLLAEFPEGVSAVDWNSGAVLDLADDEIESEPAEGARFAPPPPAAAKARQYATWKKSLTDQLYRSQKLDLLFCADLDQYSHPGESERDFRVRLQQSAREERDTQAEKLRAKFGPKVAALEERIRKAQQAVEKQRAESRTSMLGTIISVGSTFAGAFLGRKKLSAATLGKAATAARGVGRMAQQKSDVGRATDNVEALQQDLADLEAQFKAELDALATKVDPATIALETKTIKPKKTNISVQTVALAWAPYWQAPGADAIVAWE